jgi:hypothetical protein
MKVDAEFILKIKMTDLNFNNSISGMEMKQKLHEEGDKRLRLFAAGRLLDPEGKVISSEINYKIKED